MRFISILLLFLFFSCSQSRMGKDVLPSEKMQSVLWDVMKADELLSLRQLKDSSFSSFRAQTALYDTVFAIHHINKEVFKKSLQYYQSHPDLLKIILDSLQKKTEVGAPLPVQ